MAVRTRVFSFARHTTTALDVLYTIPTDRTGIVKDARLSVFGAGTTHISVRRAGTQTVRLLSVTSTAGVLTSGAAPTGLWVPLEEGDEIILNGTSGLSVDGFAGGALLDGDPQ